MIRSFNGKTPRIAGSAWVSEAAYVVGDVEIGENCGVWPGAVIRGDVAAIKIGSFTTVQDNCVIHSGSPFNPPGDAVIGENHADLCLSIGWHGHGMVMLSRKAARRGTQGFLIREFGDLESGSQICALPRAERAGGGAQAIRRLSVLRVRFDFCRM